MRRTVVERSEHLGHASVLVGWIDPGVKQQQTTWEPVCERCRKRLEAEKSTEKAESSLRRHRIKCQPKVRIKKRPPTARPSGTPHTVATPPDHTGHSPVLAGWVYEQPKANNRCWIPVCERCSKAFDPEKNRDSATKTLKKHRRNCRPLLRVGRRTSGNQAADAKA